MLILAIFFGGCTKDATQDTDLAARVAAIEDELGAGGSDSADTSSGDDLSGRVDALESRVTTLEGTMSALEGGLAAVDALTKQVAQLEHTVLALQAQAGTPTWSVMTDAPGTSSSCSDWCEVGDTHVDVTLTRPGTVFAWCTASLSVGHVYDGTVVMKLRGALIADDGSWVGTGDEVIDYVTAPSAYDAYGEFPFLAVFEPPGAGSYEFHVENWAYSVGLVGVNCLIMQAATAGLP